MIQSNNNTIEFLLGRAKTGKTHEILNRIAENEKSGQPSLLIVPSGYTFECEKLLAKHCKGGFMYTTVCGFYNFGQKVLAENKLDKAFITQQGIVMVIRRCLENAKLNIFASTAKQTGFALLCDSIISNFITCELTPKDIKEAAQKLEQGSILQRKLFDLAAIYELFDSYLSETGQIVGAACETICQSIPQSKLCDSHVFIDGIENPGDQTFKMIHQLCLAAKDVTVALRTDASSDEDIFTREDEIYAKLKAMAKDNGINVKITRLERENKYGSTALCHVEKELFKLPCRKFSGDSSCIELMAATDVDAEVDMLCDAVLHKAKSGVRFRNMAIVAADPKKYDVLIKHKFQKCGIPIFYDNKLNLASTTAARFVIASLRCVASRFKSRDIISLIKTGYANINRKEAEILENYIVAYGISGSDFTKPFERGDIPSIAEDVRQRLILPLQNLLGTMARSNVLDKTKALETYLQESQTEQKIKITTEQFAAQGKLMLVKQYEQIWKLICEMLAELKNVMGDSMISIEKYASIVEEGLAADIVGVIPSGVDMISYGDAENDLPPDIDYIFIIGATEGDFPVARPDINIIDDTELADIKAAGLSVWLSSESKRMKDKADIYTLLTAANKGIYISYPMLFANEEKNAAMIVHRLSKMLDKPFTANTDPDCPYRCYDIDKVAADMRRLADTKQLAQSDIPYLAWYLNSEAHSLEIKVLQDAVFFDPNPAPLEREFAAQMYENGLYGNATRLETFNRCPFSHFAKYSLRAKERKEYSQRAVDTGSFCHEIIDAFVQYVLKNNVNMDTLTKDECDSITQMLSDKVAENYNNGMFNKNSRYIAKKRYAVRMAKDTVQAIRIHMQAGEFSFLSSEVKFGNDSDCMFPPISLQLNNGLCCTVSGKIDRIDTFTDPKTQTENLRVIDYKLNGMAFDFTELYSGIKLQLPLYLQAVNAVGNVGCAMFYMPVSRAVLKDTDTTSQGAVLEAVMKKFRLSGLCLNDPQVTFALDNNFEKNGKTTIMQTSKRINNKSFSCIIPQKQLDAVRKFAMKKATQTATEIIQGRIDVSPYKKKDKTECKYCPYSSFCMFDSDLGSKYRDIKEIDVDAFFDETV